MKVVSIKTLVSAVNLTTISKKIKFLVGLAIFSLSFILFYYGVPPSPISSDVLWYAQVGISGIEDPFILNRYFHVFLQRFFFEIAPSNLEGYRILWSLLVSLTLSLTFVGATTLSSSLMGGLLPLLSF